MHAINWITGRARGVAGFTLIKTASIYVFANIINSAIPFFLMPVLTRYLTPADYGIVAMFGVLVGLVSPFTGLNVHGAVSRQYVRRDYIDLPEYIGNCLVLLTASSSLVAAALWLGKETVSRLSYFPQTWLWAVVAVSVCQFVINIVLVLWRMQFKASAYGAFQIANTLANAVFSILLVVVFKQGWQGRVEGQVLATVIFAAISLVILINGNWVKLRYNREYLVHAFKFGAPLVPHALGGFLLTMTGRVLVANMVGIAETGLYTVGYQVGAIIGLLENSVNQAWAPWLFDRLKRGGQEEKVRLVKVTYAYFLGLLAVALLLSVSAPWFLRFWVGKEFAGSVAFIVWIALGYAFNGMYKMVVGYIFYAEKTYILAWVTFITAAANLVLSYLFIRLNGAVGAAQAMTVSFFLSFIGTWVLSAKVYPMPWKLCEFLGNRR